jgi:hypothetical protein
MRRILLTAAAALGLGVLALGAQAAQDAKGESKEVKGVLIDNACGGKQASEEAAAKHPKACAMKEGCAKSGYGVMSGKTLVKFDEAGNAKAKEYLAVAENETKVVVVGTVSEDGKTIKVTEIKPQAKKAESDKGA